MGQTKPRKPRSNKVLRKRGAPKLRTRPRPAPVTSVLDLLQFGLAEREPGEMDAAQLMAETGLSMSAVHARMRVLEAAGKVTSRTVRGTHRPVRVWRPV